MRYFPACARGNPGYFPAHEIRAGNDDIWLDGFPPRLGNCRNGSTGRKSMAIGSWGSGVSHPLLADRMRGGTLKRVSGFCRPALRGVCLLKTIRGVIPHARRHPESQ